MNDRPPTVVTIDGGASADPALLGGKAASLVRLAEAGAAVPPAFVLTTEAFRAWAAGGDETLLEDAIWEGVRDLERRTGLAFGSARDPLIVSVRSGAPVSMPGMMETILNVGVPADPEGASANFQRRLRLAFLWQFAELVAGVDEPGLAAVRAELADEPDPAALTAALADAAERGGFAWPRTPAEELVAAVEAVLRSWHSDRARLYRRMRGIDDDLGTAVTVQEMAFGNRDARSGSGVVFSRDPRTGERGLVGEYVRGGQGEEIVSGRKTPDPIAALQADLPRQYEELERLADALEADAGAVQEIEFTVDGGTLFLLQARAAKLTAEAAARAAVELFEDGRLEQAAALGYAERHGFSIDERDGRCVESGAEPAGTGIAVGGGVVVGRVALTAEDIERWAAEGAVFVAEETSPEHLWAMQRCIAVVTMRGGATSHAAVVARELGRPCVVGVGGKLSGLDVEMDETVRAGELVTVDGGSGTIYRDDVAGGVEASDAFHARILRRWAAS
jgi:pyruvate, orthophosphate dikinase